jgi:TonB-linked SusC/RagA family outer membrane protein
MKKIVPLRGSEHANEFLKFIRIMKLAILFILFTAYHVQGSVFGQKVTVNAKQTEIKKILNTIEKNGDVRFLYNYELASLNTKVDFKAENLSLTAALDKLFASTELTYKILENNLVVILRKGTDTKMYEVIKITGKVTSSNGEGVPAATIRVKGTAVVTSADALGRFTITAPDNATLVFSSVGFNNAEVAVNGKKEINIVLSESEKVLDQVVVVGYGSQRKIDVTGSVAHVKGDEIVKQASYNPLSALQGKVAGLQVTNNGAPGAPPSLLIRGAGTIYGNTNPLYVVDGVWFSDISFLNSNDIESISLLKDASSESIYGIQAANGVVLITTKKGAKTGKPVISYNGFVGNQVVTNQVDMATGPQYETMINELNVLNGSAPTYANPSAAGNTDWYHQILRNAMVTSHQISVLGGSDKSTYNFSLGYFHQDGLVKTNNFDRYNIHLKNDYQLAKFLKVGVNVTGLMSQSNDIDGSIFHQLYTAAPNVPVYYADHTYGDPNDFLVGTSNQYNPQVTLDFYHHATKTYKLNGSAYADLKFANHFTFHTSIGGDFEQAETNQYTPVYKATLSQRSTVSTLTEGRDEIRNWIIDNNLTYDNKFGKHSIKVFVAQEAQQYKSYSLTAGAQNVPAGSGNQYISLGTTSTAFVTDGGSLSNVSSYFGRVNYAFNDKYLLNATIRGDGSSKFTGSNQWGYFPSVGLGWIITNEKFMQHQNLFNNLKLRGSWGVVGNVSVPANLSVLTVTQNAGLVYVGGNGTTATGASVQTVVPPTTYWEKGVGTDIGLEGALIHNKLNAEVDWYNKQTQNAIFAIPILASLGTSGGTVIGNQATFQNQGLEFLVSWKDQIKKDWSYSISANAGFNTNKVLAVSTGANPIYQQTGTTGGSNWNTRTMLGRPMGEFYGFQVIGVFQSAADVASYKSASGNIIQPNAKPGDFKYKDINGDGVIDGKDDVPLGNPNPKMVYGINTNVTYKNFDLTIDFQGLAGVQIYNANLGLRYGTENFTADYYNNRWHGEGTSKVYPSANIGGGQNYLSNSFFVETGNYFRIRNLQLGYSVPENSLKNSGITKLRIYANAQNAFNFFKYRGFSPEVPAGNPTATNIDQGVYPLYATYNFGVNLSF